MRVELGRRVKRWLKLIVPAAVLDGYRRLRRHREWARNAALSAEEIFTDIYAKEVWGKSADGSFASGSGSSGSAAEQYVTFVADFIKSRSIASIVDVGCGDFRVGFSLMESLYGLQVKYHGIDVVKYLVDYNNDTFSDNYTKFSTINAITHDLPDGDICLIRQVLQHLSNKDIIDILTKTAKYSSVIIAEHHPDPELLTTHNADKVRGADTRIVDGSGIFIEREPFNFESRMVLRIPFSSTLKSTGEYLAVYVRERTKT
jgi:2-polyprenyl-3-methyl-5-hydroxy-6-metoxy-1,4-benzoquinol methylase